MSDEPCDHIAAVTEIKPATSYACAECVKIGGQWVHLRTCQSCGVTHCCDSSPHQHARKHNAESGHQVIASAEPGERWLWCYEHEGYAQY